MQRKKIFLIRLCSFAVILYTATKKVQFDNLSMGLHWNTKLGLRYLVAVGVVFIPSATKSKYLLVELNNQNTNIGQQNDRSYIEQIRVFHTKNQTNYHKSTFEYIFEGHALVDDHPFLDSEYSPTFNRHREKGTFYKIK